MDYVEHYYQSVHGFYPFDDDENKIKSQKIIDYLEDVGMDPGAILMFVEEAPAVDCLTPDILPDWMWTGSLLKRDTFYYHGSLHIVSPPPTWDPRTGQETMVPFYMEMRIQFTMQDLLNYYYMKIRPEPELRDAKKDAGALSYLLTRYGKLTIIEAVDFLLHNIDYAAEQIQEMPIINVVDLSRYENDVYSMLKAKAAQAKVGKVDRIIWR